MWETELGDGQALLFCWGCANERYSDQCYHKKCDDMTNINHETFLVNTKGIAYSVAKYALSWEGIPKVDVEAVKREPKSNTASSSRPMFSLALAALIFVVIAVGAIKWETILGLSLIKMARDGVVVVCIRYCAHPGSTLLCSD